MKLVLILFILPMLLLLTGCGSSGGYDSDSSFGDSDGNCYEPSNPYGDGGGHDAGFNRAEETGGDCNGNSNSFNEGCEEYYAQLEEYENCIN